MEHLTVADIQSIIAQGVAEAQAQNQPSGFVVIDRVGNVLAVFVMNGTNLTLRTPPAPNGQNTDLQGLNVPAPGRRPADRQGGDRRLSLLRRQRLLDPHREPDRPAAFPALGRRRGPGERAVVRRAVQPAALLRPRRALQQTGTHRGPLGVGADPGGFPLYKNGVVVGAVGVIGDGVYGFDTEYTDNDRSAEETIALAATTGFEPNVNIRADRISVDGTLLRYSDATPADFRSNPATAAPFGSINNVQGSLVAVRGYNAATIIPGTAYGTEASGIRAATAAEFGNPDAFVLSDGSGANRYPIIAGTDAVASPLTAAEVRAILEEAFKIMSAARAQIRRPLDNRAQVTIVVVDTNGRGARHRPLARRADLRHRRLAAEGAHRDVLLEPDRGRRSPAIRRRRQPMSPRCAASSTIPMR